jgi:hypothetical protein
LLALRDLLVFLKDGVFWSVVENAMTAWPLVTLGMQMELAAGYAVTHRDESAKRRLLGRLALHANIMADSN